MINNDNQNTNNSSNLFSLEEFKKLALEINNSNQEEDQGFVDIDEILESLPPISNIVDIELIELHSGEFVQNSDNEYTLLNNKYYTTNLYALIVDVIVDYNGDIILRSDSVKVFSNWGDYFNNKQDLYIQKHKYTLENNYNAFYSLDTLDTNIYYINNFIRVPSDFTKDEKGVYKYIPIALETLPYYNNLVENLNLFYPEKWDFKPVKEFKFKFPHSISDELKYWLVIHFDNIRISNSYDNSHNISDLYVALAFSNKGFMGNIIGTRTTISNLEKGASYFHSHLPSTHELGRFNRFCTGSGEINNCLINLKTEYEDIKMKALLAILKPYLEWESLEGGPHNKMSNIVNKSYVNKTHSTQFDKKEICKIIEDNIHKFNLFIDEQEGLFDISDSNIEEVLSEYPKLSNCYKDPMNLQYFTNNSFNSNSYKPETFNETLFVFRNTEIKGKITNQEVKKENLIKTVHPYVTKTTREFLVKRINEYYFKKKYHK